MPAVSSTMTEGKIVSWVKSQGDKLSKGESVGVVESDKADMDVESFYDGYLAAIIVDEGSSAPVGSAIALLAESEEEIAVALEQAQKSAAPEAVAAAPAVTESVVSSESVGVEKQKKVAPAIGTAVHPASEGGKRVVASPYAKKLAKELGVDLRGVVGSGPNGRVVAKDVEAAATLAASEVATASSDNAAAAAALPGVELGSTVPFTTMQNAVSRNMVESLAVPTFRVGYTITTDALDALYKKVKCDILGYYCFLWIIEWILGLLVYFLGSFVICVFIIVEMQNDHVLKKHY